MLRGRALGRAALVLALALWAVPAAANETIGASCSGGADAAQSADGNNVVCIGGVWQYPAYQHGSTSNSCSGTTAGRVQYTSGTLEACNGTSWIPIDPSGHFIATVTASSSASIQFTNLPSTYNTLFLNCTGILLSVSGAILSGYVGEGAGPTWETGAHYTTMGFYMNGSSTLTGTYATTSAYFFIESGSTTIPQSWKMYIDNVGSSSLYKMITITGVGYNGVVAFNPALSWAYWNNDKNVITGIELVPASGNIASGTCSLYGTN